MKSQSYKSEDKKIKQVSCTLVFVHNLLFVTLLVRGIGIRHALNSADLRRVIPDRPADMVNILLVAVLIFSTIVGSVTARNGCRQCTGILTYNLTGYITEKQARDELVNSLGTCGTGHQYIITSVKSDGCLTSDLNRCRKWDFGLTIYRYCGNGGGVNRGRNVICDGSPRCFYGEYLQLICTHSVECVGKCDCTECAC